MKPYVIFFFLLKFTLPFALQAQTLSSTNQQAQVLQLIPEDTLSIPHTGHPSNLQDVTRQGKHWYVIKRRSQWVMKLAADGSLRAKIELPGLIQHAFFCGDRLHLLLNPRNSDRIPLTDSVFATIELDKLNSATSSWQFHTFSSSIFAHGAHVPAIDRLHYPGFFVKRSRACFQDTSLVLLPLRKFQNTQQPDYWETNHRFIGLLYDTKTKQETLIPLRGPEDDPLALYRDQFREYVFSFTHRANTFLYGFSYRPFLIEKNQNLETVDSFSVRSVMDEGIVPTGRKSRADTIVSTDQYDLSQGEYNELYYNPNNHLYYRIYRLPFPEDARTDIGGWRSTMIVFDSTHQVIGETLLPLTDPSFAFFDGDRIALPTLGTRTDTSIGYVFFRVESAGQSAKPRIATKLKAHFDQYRLTPGGIRGFIRAQNQATDSHGNNDKAIDRVMVIPFDYSCLPVAIQTLKSISLENLSVTEHVIITVPSGQDADWLRGMYDLPAHPNIHIVPAKELRAYVRRELNPYLLSFGPEGRQKWEVTTKNLRQIRNMFP